VKDDVAILIFCACCVFSKKEPAYFGSEFRKFHHEPDLTIQLRPRRTIDRVVEKDKVFPGTLLEFDTVYLIYVSIALVLLCLSKKWAVVL